MLCRVIKRALNPSSKLAELDLQTQMVALEQVAKMTGIDM